MWAFIRSKAADLSDFAIQLTQHIFMASVSDDNKVKCSH